MSACRTECSKCTCIYMKRQIMCFILHICIYHIIFPTFQIFKNPLILETLKLKRPTPTRQGLFIAAKPKNIFSNEHSKNVQICHTHLPKPQSNVPFFWWGYYWVFLILSFPENQRTHVYLGTVPVTEFQELCSDVFKCAECFKYLASVSSWQ